MIKFIKYLFRYKKNLQLLKYPPLLLPLTSDTCKFDSVEYKINIYRKKYELPQGYGAELSNEFKKRHLADAKYDFLLEIKKYIEVEYSEDIVRLSLPFGIRINKE